MILDKIQNYFDLNDRLKVLFVFDQFNQIQSELDEVVWPEGWHYVVFNNDWFNIKYHLATDWASDRVVLLFQNMLEPGTDAEHVLFPLYGEMMANMVFRTESYQSFMQLRNIPSTKEYTLFFSRHIDELQLSRVDKILSPYYTASALNIDTLQRGLLSSWLRQEKLLTWNEILIRTVIILGLESEKTRCEQFARAIKNNKDISDALSAQFERVFGNPLNAISPTSIKACVESYKYNAITQNLVAISADDYKAYKMKGAMELQSLNNFIQNVLQHPLRAKFEEAVAILASGIKEAQIIKWYGPTADYALLTEELCAPMLEALSKEIATKSETLSEQLRSIQLKLGADSQLLPCARFLSQACLVYQRRKSFGTFKLNSRQEFIYRYKTEFYLIDMAYRHSCFDFSRVSPAVSIFAAISGAKQALDDAYAAAVNEFNLEWMKRVVEEGGRLNDIDGILHQQDFFDKRIKPLSTKTAVIISDALRYEVAVQLMQELSEKKHTATIDVALAMLPTETKYCKDALLPHGDLRLQGDSMFVDGNILNTLDDRAYQLAKYRTDSACVNFSEVYKGIKKNWEKMQKQLVYIYHDEIDVNSHKKPEKVGAVCEDAVDELKKFIATLHASYNFTNVIVTSDHGFLYNDKEFADKDKHKVVEDSIELKTRYYLTSSSTPSKDVAFGITKLPLEEVSGMGHHDGVFVAVPNGSNRFFAPGGGYEFAHGGATLQELIIPVVTSYIQREDAKQKVDVTLLEHDLTVVSSQLKFNLVQVQAVSVDAKERSIVCSLYSGNTEVSSPVRIVLNSADAANFNNRIFPVQITLKVAVTDPLLELRIYDVADTLNPLIKRIVNNRTLIEQDF